MTRWRENGGSNIGCIFSFALLLFVIFVGIKVVPTRIAVAEMQDFCEREADRASLPRVTNDAITEALFHKAKEEDLPIRKEDIKVTRDGVRVRILIQYHVMLDFVVYKYDWAVEHKVERVLF
jgi:hypothetical protein